MSQPPQPPADEPQSVAAHPPIWTGSAGWSGSVPPEGGQGAHGWAPQAAPPQGAWPQPWSQPWPLPVFPGPPVGEQRSAARAPLVLGLVALGALIVGGVAGFLIGIFAFMAGAEGMGMGMEDPFLGPVEEFPAVPPADLGPDPVLDEYADACFAGDFQACDDLMYESPPLSEYEEYGATCAGRVKPYDVMACTDLE